MRKGRLWLCLWAVLVLAACGGTDPKNDRDALDLSESFDAGQEVAGEVAADAAQTSSRRIPGEWEPHKATWMQWPTEWEKDLKSNFAGIIDVVQEYEPLNIVVLDQAMKTSAIEYLDGKGVPDKNITWRIAPYDSAWLRDNGPVYVEEDGGIVLLDFGFDAWGGHFGSDVTWEDDNAIPAWIAEQEGLASVDYNDYIMERGNLEANGAGTIVMGWDCQSDRNPGLSREEQEALLKERLGVTQVLWVDGHDPEDGTTGHIDGIVRFVSPTKVAVARSLIEDDPYSSILEAAATTMADAGFEVVRVNVRGNFSYGGYDLPAYYMNWLVGNGFVAITSFGNEEWDAEAKTAIEALYPGRDVHLVPSSDLWLSGGGIHCVTNDQPAND